MSQLVDILLEIRKEQQKYYDDYEFWAKKIKTEAEKQLGESRVLVFGSILRKNEVPRDIDILVISPAFTGASTRKKSEIKVQLWKKIGAASPFEIHLISPEDWEEWYKNFIKEFIEI